MSSSAFNELDFYLNRDMQFSDDEINNFDVLAWWRLNQHSYPVLVAMARDVLTSLVSTVPLESAFSAGNRVLDPKRSRLSPKILEMCVCFKDWLNVELEQQGTELVDESSEDEVDN